MFAEVVYTRPIKDMILAGHLCDVRAIRYRLDIDLDRVKRVGTDYGVGALDNAMRAANAIPAVVDGYLEHLVGKRAIVYAPTIEMAYDVGEAFRQRGIAAETVEGETAIDERRAILNRLHTGEH